MLLTNAHPENISEESYKLIIPLRDVESRFGDWDVFFRSLTELAKGDDAEFLERFEDIEDFNCGDTIVGTQYLIPLFWTRLLLYQHSICY